MSLIKIMEAPLMQAQNKDDIIKKLLEENAGLKKKILRIQAVIKQATESFKLFSLAFKSDI